MKLLNNTTSDLDTRVYQLFNNYLDAYDYLTLDCDYELLKKVVVSFSAKRGFVFDKVITFINENPEKFFCGASAYLTCKKYSDDIVEIKLGRKVTITMGDVIVHGE